jgi:hypothetical protein
MMAAGSIVAATSRLTLSGTLRTLRAGALRYCAKAPLLREPRKS